ncbi:MAG TPA: trypsin-like peptidase domain-containing protein [Terracidiphilus sp.]|nr:trypsin-like peptidase domain-containing protein [Terracidiphilus sp.]
MKKVAAPLIASATLVLTFAFLSGHNSAHAAAAASGPLDESSVSSLVALDNAVEAVAARVTPAVVNVAVTSRVSADNTSDNGQDGGISPQDLPPGFRQFFYGFGGQGMKPQPQFEHGIGSGVIISPDGYIVTNNHVVDGATQIRVTLDDRRVFTAKLVGVDKLNDLAVIKIDGHNLTSIPWGDSTKLHPGQTVLAFGNPFGNFPFTVTRGIVSGLNRPNPYSDDARKPGDFIQTDAAINPGNSGGPLVNAYGEVVGIDTFIISNSGSFAGAGFAIPTQIVKNSVNQIIKNGSVKHGYLGISMNDVTPDNSSFFNLPDASGAIISQVTPDSPASRAGLENGDVIRSLNGGKIANGSALQVAVSGMMPGNSIELGILRNGKPETIHVTVGEYNAKGTEEASNSGSGNSQRGKLGLAVDNLTPDVRQQFNIPDRVHGAAIESVRPGSAAEDAGLQPGDVIMEVNRHAVDGAQSCVNAIHAVPAGKDVLLLVWSNGGASYRVVHPDQGEQNGM